MAALILVLLAMGLYMTSLPEGDARWAWYTPHKSLGMIAFLLLLARLARRLWGAPPPPLPAHTPAWERAAAHLTHALLYALMLLLPVTGYLDSAAGGYHLSFFDLFEVPKLVAPDKALELAATRAHRWLAYALLALLALHLGAVAKHHLVDREPVLRRMLPGRGR
jgi:cytochrome b561